MELSQNQNVVCSNKVNCRLFTDFVSDHKNLAVTSTNILNCSQSYVKDRLQNVAILNEMSSDLSQNQNVVCLN